MARILPHKHPGWKFSAHPSVCYSSCFRSRSPFPAAAAVSVLMTDTKLGDKLKWKWIKSNFKTHLHAYPDDNSRKYRLQFAPLWFRVTVNLTSVKHTRLSACSRPLPETKTVLSSATHISQLAGNQKGRRDTGKMEENAQGREPLSLVECNTRTFQQKDRFFVD